MKGYNPYNKNLKIEFHDNQIIFRILIKKFWEQNWIQRSRKSLENKILQVALLESSDPQRVN